MTPVTQCARIRYVLYASYTVQHASVQSASELDFVLEPTMQLNVFFLSLQDAQRNTRSGCTRGRGGGGGREV